MQVFSDLHRICACRNVCFHRTDVVVAIICHHVVGCNESRYVSACLFGQQVIDFPVIRFASGAADCLVDSTWAAVIGCDNQIPVSINIVHLFQITGGSPGCFDRVAAFIYQTIGFKTVNLSCPNHELPQSRGAGTWHSRRIQCGFDNRQVLQFQRKSVSVQCFFKNRHIEIAGAQHEWNLIAQATRVHIDEFAYNVIIRHLHDSRNTWKAVNVDRITE